MIKAKVKLCWDIKNNIAKWNTLLCSDFNMLIACLLNVAMCFVFKIRFLLVVRKFKYRVGIATSYKK